MLADYDRLPSAAVSFSRRKVFKRDHWTCQYCGVQQGASVPNLEAALCAARNADRKLSKFVCESYWKSPLQS